MRGKVPLQTSDSLADPGGYSGLVFDKCDDVDEPPEFAVCSGWFETLQVKVDVAVKLLKRRARPAKCE